MEAVSVKGIMPGWEETSTWIDGDIEDARKIARASFDMARQFSEAVIRGDIEQAHSLCTTELRDSTTVEALKARLQEEDEEWEGTPIEYSDQGIYVIYVAETSELRSNRNHDWPKKAPKESRRALLTSWWTTEKTPEGGSYGRPVEFWIAEEAEGYRVAKFMPTRS